MTVIVCDIKIHIYPLFYEFYMAYYSAGKSKEATSKHFDCLYISYTFSPKFLEVFRLIQGILLLFLRIS